MNCSFSTCKKCHSAMAVLDTLLEGYDLVCMRCGGRERIEEYRLVFIRFSGSKFVTHTS